MSISRQTHRYSSGTGIIGMGSGHSNSIGNISPSRISLQELKNSNQYINYVIQQSRKFPIRCKNFLFLFVPIILGLLYYQYLQNLYFINIQNDVLSNQYKVFNNHTYDDPKERLTIQIIAPRKIQHLNNFINHYSSCPIVYQIQILYHSPLDYDLPMYHDKTTVVIVEDMSDNVNGVIYPYNPDTKIKTEAILMILPSLFIDCDDLVFTFKVWRSSKIVPVGFFPSLHKVMNENPSIISYYSSWYVWFNEKYSLLSNDIIIISRHHYYQLSKNEHIKSLVLFEPICNDVIPIQWIVYSENASPILVKVPIKRVYKEKLNFKKSHIEYLEWEELEKKYHGSNQILSQCLTSASRSMNMSTSIYSKFKSVKANSLLFW